MGLSIYDLALHTTLKVCELKGKESILGPQRDAQTYIARCMFVRLLAVRGCSDTEIAEYAHRARQVISRTRRKAEQLAQENTYFGYNFDYANHILNESISVAEG